MKKPNKFVAVLLSCILLISFISAPASASGIGGGGYSSGGSSGRFDWFDLNNYNDQPEWSYDGTASLTLDHIDAAGRWFRINTSVYNSHAPVWSTSNYCSFNVISRDNGNSMSVECVMKRTTSRLSFEMNSQSLIPHSGTYYLGISVDNLAYTYPNYLPVIKCGPYDITSSPLGYHLSNTCFSFVSGNIESYTSTDIFYISADTQSRTLNVTVSFFLVLTDVPDSLVWDDTPSTVDDDLFTGIGGKIPNNKIIDTTEKKIYSPRQDIDIPIDVDQNFSYDFNTYTYTYVDISNNITYNITYGDDKVVYAEQYTENGDIINYNNYYYYSDPTLSPGDLGNTGIGGLLDNFWSWLGELLSSLWDFILDIVGDLFTLIKTIIQGFLSIFTTTVTEIITALGNFFTYYTDGTLYDFSGVT